MQLVMSIGTLLVGLAIALLLDPADSAGMQSFGWLIAGLGAVGIVLRFVLPTHHEEER
jgi:hypothetical protein